MLQQIWLYEIIGDTLQMGQNTTMRVNGALIKSYCVLCSKTYNTLHGCHNFPAGSRQAARVARICETSLLDNNKTIRTWLMDRMEIVDGQYKVDSLRPNDAYIRQ